MKYYLLLTLVFIIFNIFAEGDKENILTQDYKISDNTTFTYSKTNWLNVITDVPQSYKYFFKESFSKDNLFNLGLIASSTLILYHYDPQLINGVQKWGRKLGIGNDDATQDMIKYKRITLFRGPMDLGSSFYYIGDGWSHTLVLLSFLGYGKATNNFRAEATSHALMHGLLLSTIGNQFLKRTTGRESPYRATKRRGNWDLFPNQNKYNSDTSKYDAFPSGHVATLTMTSTVILENYPEYKSYLQPLFLTLGSILALQMMNNGVHWASDYPLAIGMGYLYGKIAAQTGRTITHYNGEQKTSYMILPIITPSTGGGVQLISLF